MGIRRDALVLSATVIALVVGLAGCSQKKAPGPAGAQSSQAAATTPASSSGSVGPAKLSISAAPGATDVSPVVPIKVAVTDGSISSVVMTNADGKVIKGALAPDRSSWSSAEDLGYGKTYQLRAVAANAEGKQTSESSSFTTVTPDNQTMPYIQTAAGGAVPAGVVFGVGQVIRIHFDESIPDHKAAMAAIKVTTVPAQLGGFSWLSDTDLYWRTASYMKPGTKVTIDANVYGKNLGNNLYGQADTSTWFRVGDSHVSIADDRTKLVKVYTNGKLVKVMKTSMGRHTSIKGDNGQPIDLRTNSGPHVVVDGETDIDMNSASFGLSKGENAYRTTVPVGVRISYDGEYVHWADWSVWAQGNTDTSHGCLNVSPDDSWWFYHYSRPGDIVDVRNTGRALQEWNSGFWTVSFAKWIASGAQA
ncbi:MAG TPA: Ig-like domain-containing protein [Jatrophihabitans sp.]|nr:Ig-like domain-containing protein [Jatrophihabitans sp.]